MLFLLGNSEKKQRKSMQNDENYRRVKDLFTNGRFPVVTTETIEDKAIERVLGLVACRGYDSEEAFFGMTLRAVNKGAQAIIGYKENVAFHPDGSRYFSCYGTAVQFAKDSKSLARKDQNTAQPRAPQGKPALKVPVRTKA
nr:hypothetical protein [Oceanidesulfovibrio indonesiensis]